MQKLSVQHSTVTSPIAITHPDRLTALAATPFGDESSETKFWALGCWRLVRTALLSGSGLSQICGWEARASCLALASVSSSMKDRKQYLIDGSLGGQNK